ncbi:hypothetical protein [Streptomyces erythrochromogenes]|uniref:hypothetical protein n=1 Tax=Streptomyces erythrochromogenes TaxID=285574 RepID=UPI00367B2D9B
MEWDGIDCAVVRTVASIGPSAAVGRAAPTGTAGPDEGAGPVGDGDAVDGACARCGCGGADPDGGPAVHDVTASSASPYRAPLTTSLRLCLLSPNCPTPVVEPAEA